MKISVRSDDLRIFTSPTTTYVYAIYSHGPREPRWLMTWYQTPKKNDERLESRYTILNNERRLLRPGDVFVCVKHFRNVPYFRFRANEERIGFITMCFFFPARQWTTFLPDISFQFSILLINFLLFLLIFG